MKLPYIGIAMQNIVDCQLSVTKFEASFTNNIHKKTSHLLSNTSMDVRLYIPLTSVLNTFYLSVIYSLFGHFNTPNAEIRLKLLVQLHTYLMDTLLTTTLYILLLTDNTIAHLLG